MKREGFFRSLWWTLKGLTLAIYHLVRAKKQKGHAVSEGLTHRALEEAVAKHLERMCHVKPFIEQRIFKDVDLRTDVWAHKGNRWYLCEVKRAGVPDLFTFSTELDGARAQIKRRDGRDYVSCYVAVTEELYDGLSNTKLTQLHDVARNQHIGILTVGRSGHCKEVLRGV